MTHEMLVKRTETAFKGASKRTAIHFNGQSIVLALKRILGSLSKRI